MTKRRDLSRREQAVLDFIVTYVEANGYPPSMREIGKGIGLYSTSSVKLVLERLEGAGCIKRPTDGRARAIQVVP